MKILSDKIGVFSLNKNTLAIDSGLLRLTAYSATNVCGSFSLLNNFTNDFSAWFVDLKIKNISNTIAFISRVPAICLYISIVNSMHCRTAGLNEKTIHEKSFIFCFVPSLYTQIPVTKKKDYSFFALFISLHYLKEIKNHYAALPDFLKSIHQNKPLRYFEYPLIAGNNVFTALQNIKHSQNENEFNDACKSVLTDCLSIIEGNKNKIPGTVKLKDAEKVNRVRKFIDKNITERRLSLLKILRQTKVSAYVAKTYFKRMHHITLHKYINIRRVELSVSLLLTTNRTLSDIASAMGFKYTKTYTRLFKNHFNITPAQFRRKGQKS